MNDDQFQGNLNVQGGYPESDAPVESGAVEQQVPAEPESEMSRRMNEMLGGFDNGITTGSGNSEVAQSAVPGNNTPLPDYAQQTPAQAEPVAQNNAFYDTNDTLESYATAPADIAQQPTSVPTPPPVSTSFFDAATGATPVMTGTPRSNIEQAAVEQAAQAAAASNKKSHAKILLVIILIILVIAGAGAAIYIGLNGNKSGSKTSSQNTNNVVEDQPADESPVEEEQRIGTEAHGYVSVPKDWARMVSGDVSGSEFGYSTTDKSARVILNSAAIDSTMTAENFANGEFAKAQSAGFSQPQMTNEKNGEYNMYKIFYYSQENKEWTFKYVFEAEDKRVHYIQVIVPDNTFTVVKSVPASWSLNQNSAGAPVTSEEE